MTIQQQPASLSLLGNMQQLVIGSIADVTMTLCLQGSEENLVEHTYSPDKGGTIRVDLRDIVEAQLSFLLQNTQTAYQQYNIVRAFTGTLVSGEQTETFSFTVIRAGVDQLADSAENFLAQNFLTWQPTVKPVTYYTPEFLTYYAQQQCTVKGTAYDSQGHGTAITIAALSSGACYTIPTGYAVIAGIAGSLPSYYDVWVEDANGTRLTYIQRYYASDIKSEEEQWILFENSLGGIDTFRAYGDSENTAQHEHKIAEIEDENVEYRVDTERKHKKSTGLLDKYERRWLLDFFPSKAKYIYTESSIRRIVVTESDVNYTAKELPSEYNFTYKFADDKPYLNIPRTDASLAEMHIDVPDIGSFTIAPRLVEFPRQTLSGGALIPTQDPYSENWGVTTLAAIAAFLLGDTTFTEGLPQNGLSENDVLAIVRTFVNGKYISKINDDEAAGLISFRKGLISLLQARFGNYLRDGANDSGAAITPEGIGDFIGLIFTNYLKSRGARSGFTDGKGILMDAVRGIIETDGLEVRGFMRIMELVINRLQLMESDYSFTEGGEIEHVDYAAGGRLLLRMHKRHDNDYTPFYYGDIIYAKVNDLLPKDAAVPNGHTATKNGSYYTVWMVVRDVDYTTNTLTVTLYNSLKPNGDPAVPGGYNFTPYGTPIQGTDDPSVAIADERAIVVDGHTLDETGFDCCITVTRHGNIADGVNPDTGETDDQIRQRQEDRQQSWVLSTTDKRLSFFWHVDQPFIRDDNYALSLGMVPDLKNLPHDGSGRPLWDTRMPALYVNTIFYENIHHIYYPSRVVKVDRGAWSGTPLVTYSGPSGTYTPDGTLTAAEQLALGTGGIFINGQMIAEPYHFESLTRVVWLTYRLADNWSDLSDRKLLDNLLSLWHVDIETSRVWRYGSLWECLVEGTSEEPGFTGSGWMCLSANNISLGFYSNTDPPVPIMGLSVRPGFIDETVKPYLLIGQEDISDEVVSWRWERESNSSAFDNAWKNSMHTDPENTDPDNPSPLKSVTRTLHITDADMPSGWDAGGGRVNFKCTAKFNFGGDDTEIINSINIT